MENVKNIFLVLAAAFAVLGALSAMPYHITMPAGLVCLAVSILLDAREYRNKGEKGTAVALLISALVALAFAGYKVASLLWEF